MSASTSHRLGLLKHKIMDRWVERTLKEVSAAHHQVDLALRNSLIAYLDHLVDALSLTIDRTEIRKQEDKHLSTLLGKEHGRARAISYNYSIDQVIFEYHILRQVIFDYMEEEEPLSSVEREVILCSIEQAVNDAATEYSNTLRDVSDLLTKTLAHDFRTPLQVAKLNLQLILRKPEDMESIISKASRASISLDRLDRMILDLLDVSQLKAGNPLVLELQENCNLDWIIRQVASDLNQTHENKVIIKSKGQCLGNWNEKGLRRVVENLVTNGIKYGDPHKPVTISLEETPTEAILSVHNEGVPIPKEEIAILFQQYRRSRNVKEKIGWGLGLTVVKGMTEAHQGSVQVVSEKDKGTTFKIKLPKKRNLGQTN